MKDFIVVSNSVRVLYDGNLVAVAVVKEEEDSKDKDLPSSFNLTYFLYIGMKMVPTIVGNIHMNLFTSMVISLWLSFIMLLN